MPERLFERIFVNYSSGCFSRLCGGKYHRRKKEATKNKLVDNGTNPASVDANGNPAESGNATEENAITDAATAKKQKTKDIAKSIIFFILGTAFIVGGAQHLVTFGSKLAGYMGVPERIVAITLVAIGTSLPELVTTVTSIIKKNTTCPSAILSAQTSSIFV